MGKANLKNAGFTLLEVLISSSITCVIIGGLLLGTSALQRTFRASEYYVNKQAQQLRFLDSLALDLRRAVTVNISKSSPSLPDPDIIDLTIPDFYSTASSGGVRTPRNPVITKGTAVYGTVANNPSIRYSVANGVLYRRYTERSATGNTVVNQVLCSDVQDFSIKHGSSGQLISSSVSFIPKFQWKTNTNASYRAGTAAFTSTMLRNTRLPSIP